MRIWPALAADVICILVFAIVGRRSHAEGTDLLGVLQTAWPFLAGYVVGLAVSRGWRHPLAPRSAVLLWLSTVAVAMLLRAASGAGTPWPFVLVTTVVLGLLLLGWRGLLRLVERARQRAGHSAPV
nr:DUF3054 domain-containing protein [uncultured Friedmanniella sp.]